MTNLVSELGGGALDIVPHEDRPIALGRTEAAESRRAEAVEGYRELGAVKLLERFLQEWS